MTQLVEHAFAYDDRGPDFPQSWNAYAYVGNQPLALADPLGLVCQEDQVNQDCEPGFSQGMGGYGGGGFGGGDAAGGWGEFGLESVPTVIQDGYSLLPEGGAWQQGPSWSGTIDPGMQIPFTADTSICIGCTMQYVPNLFNVGNGFDLLGSFQPLGVTAGSVDGSGTAGSNASASGFGGLGSTGSTRSINFLGVRWHSAAASACSEYPAGGILRPICAAFGSNKWANSARGCLLSVYVPGAGYLPGLSVGVPGSPNPLYGLIASHAFCLPAAAFAK